MRNIDEDARYCEARGVEVFPSSYFHPWEPHPMPEGEIQYRGCFVKPGPLIVKSCAAYTAEQMNRPLEMLHHRGAQFFQARQIAEV
jgi:hypothetical protein